MTNNHSQPFEVITPEPRTSKALVHLGVPTYDGRIHDGIMGAVLGSTNHGHAGPLQIQSGSWLTRNFNDCLAAALNARKHGVTHFCMLHEDVVPLEPCWLDKMLTLMKANSADVLSVVMPLKISFGLTSTALDVPVRDLDPHWRVKRLTMTEIYSDYPPTFTHEKLLINTGLMLIDLSKPWVEDIWFEFEDRIIKDAKGDFRAVGVPEDWNFSRRARAMGASLWATREVKAEHFGGGRWANTHSWGAQKEDR